MDASTGEKPWALFPIWWRIFTEENMRHLLQVPVCKAEETQKLERSFERPALPSSFFDSCMLWWIINFATFFAERCDQEGLSKTQELLCSCWPRHSVQRGEQVKVANIVSICQLPFCLNPEAKAKLLGIECQHLRSVHHSQGLLLVVTYFFCCDEINFKSNLSLLLFRIFRTPAAIVRGLCLCHLLLYWWPQSMTTS